MNFRVIFNGLCTSWRHCVHLLGLFCTNVSVAVLYLHAKTKRQTDTMPPSSEQNTKIVNHLFKRLAHKGYMEAMRGALREAEDGRRKAEVEAAQLRVEVEAQRRRGDDLQQHLGVAEAQVRSLTSTLSATFTAQEGLGPQGVQSQGSGSKSGSQ